MNRINELKRKHPIQEGAAVTYIDLDEYKALLGALTDIGFSRVGRKAYLDDEK
jgi:hypothetical protein